MDTTTWTDADKTRWGFRALGVVLAAGIWFGGRKAVRNRYGRGALALVAGGGAIAYGERKAEALETATPTAGEIVTDATDAEKMRIYANWGKVG